MSRYAHDGCFIQRALHFRLRGTLGQDQAFHRSRVGIVQDRVIPVSYSKDQSAVSKEADPIQPESGESPQVIRYRWLCLVPCTPAPSPPPEPRRPRFVRLSLPSPCLCHKQHDMPWGTDDPPVAENPDSSVRNEVH